MSFNPLLHGLRGMAAVLVLLYHWKEAYPAFAGTYRQLSFMGTPWNLLLPIDFGWIGVHWFFVLSGYLLAANVWTAPLTAREVRHFWARRFCRIYPAVWMQIVLLLWISHALTGLPGISWPQVLGNALLWFPPLPGGVAAYNGVWWTLPIELGFYLCLPFLVLMYRRIGFVGTLLVAAAITLGWRIGSAAMLDFSNLRSALAGMRALPGSLGLFMGGFLLNHLIRETRWQVRGSGRLLCAVVLVLFYGWIQLLIAHRSNFWNEPWLVIATDPVIGVLIASLLAVLLRPDMQTGIIHRALTTRTMHWLGELSYGIYLWHYPVLRLLPKVFPGHWGGPAGGLLALLACLLITLPLAALSYFVIERPALAWLSRRQRPVAVQTALR